METIEISFRELRKYYVEVREFVADYAGVATHEIGAYSDLENHLGIADDDLFFITEDFIQHFEISSQNGETEEEEKKSLPKYVWKVSDTLGFLSPVFWWIIDVLKFSFNALVFLSVLAGLLYVWKFIVILFTILFIWTYFTEKYETIQIPNKKQWNPESLSVADLVCMAVGKRAVYKKDIYFVIKKYD